jgi:hypothetical protein
LKELQIEKLVSFDGDMMKWEQARIYNLQAYCCSWKDKHALRVSTVTTYSVPTWHIPFNFVGSYNKYENEALVLPFQS